MDPEAEAGMYFDRGFNCAQSVLLAFAPDLGLEPEEASRVAAGFGGGMSRMQKTCGAVTGAVMVLGARYGAKGPDDEEAAVRLREKVRQLFADFSREFGETDCLALLGADLNTEEGQQKIEREGLSQSHCHRFVAYAARWLAANR